MIRRFVAIWASCLAAPVDLDAVKRRVQESTMCRDLGILFEGSVDLDVVKKRVQVSTICRDLGIAFGGSVDLHAFAIDEFFNEFEKNPMKMNDFAAFFVSSTYVER